MPLNLYKGTYKVVLKTVEYSAVPVEVSENEHDQCLKISYHCGYSLKSFLIEKKALEENIGEQD